MKICILGTDDRMKYLAELLRDEHEIVTEDAELYLLPPQAKKPADLEALGGEDYRKCADFVCGNAELTAEGAIWLLMENSREALSGKSALVLGFGRIGKLLSQKLAALNVKVSVMSKTAESLALAKAMGYGAVSPDAALSSFDFIINTAPEKIAESFDSAKEGCLLLELASAPGGFGEVPHINGGGLPGRYAPLSAAELIKNAVEDYLK